MAILSKQEIETYLKKKELITNPIKKADGTFDIQPASYDLTVGTIVKKRKSNLSLDTIQQADLEFSKSLLKQETVTLEPGQILFIVTHEIINLPKHICATVYSKNNLSLCGVLAWTTGHVDPGYSGPIIIRLINLNSTGYSIKPGTKIYTIVFDELKYSEEKLLEGKSGLSITDAVNKVTKSANESLSNALFDLALLTNFVKKDEFGQALFKWLTKTVWGILTLIVGLLTTSVALVAGILKIIESIKK